MRRIILMLMVGALLTVMLAFAGTASAHPLMFESDLSEDGIINFCNPEQLKPGLFADAISDWNSYAADNSLPRVVDVTDNAGALCELRADAQGGDSASYFARVVFNVHPDNLDISTRFNDLSAAQKGATLRHELGHAVLGLAHNHLCSESVMPTLEFCQNNGTPRRTSVGPHDVADRNEYWDGATPIYPIQDKCWTNEDADGDGVCDRHGPPGAATLGTFSAGSTSSVGGEPVWAPPARED